MLTVKQAAERIGISPSLVYALCRSGVLGHTRHGRPGKRGTIRIIDEAVTDYLAGCKGEARQEPTAIPLRHISLS